MKAYEHPKCAQRRLYDRQNPSSRLFSNPRGKRKDQRDKASLSQPVLRPLAVLLSSSSWVRDCFDMWMHEVHTFGRLAVCICQGTIEKRSSGKTFPNVQRRALHCHLNG